MKQQRILISPQFTAWQRAEFAAEGYERLGIRDMAIEAGIDPNPSAADEEVAKPEPERDNSPSFEM